MLQSSQTKHFVVKLQSATKFGRASALKIPRNFSRFQSGLVQIFFQPYYLHINKYGPVVLPKVVGVAVVLPVAAGDASCLLEPLSPWWGLGLFGAFTWVLGKGRPVDGPEEFLIHFCSCSPGWNFTGLVGFYAGVFCLLKSGSSMFTFWSFTSTTIAGNLILSRSHI